MQKLTKEQIKMIEKSIIIGKNKTVIMVEVPCLKEVSDLNHNNNIYCVNSDHEIIWQIKGNPTGFADDPFTSIWLENDELLAKNFSGFKYKVNLENGETELVSWSK